MNYLVIVGIVVLLFFLIKTKIKPSLLFFSLLSIFFFLKLITLETLLVNYVNPGVITLLLLIVVVATIEKTYLIDYLATIFFKENSPRISIFRLTLITSVLSSFMNNTAVVVSLLNPIKSNRHFPPSKFLIPLSYAAILGGATTLIGTSTNLVVNSFVVSAGLPSLKMFDFIYVGIPILICGIIYIVLFSNKILPTIKIVGNKKNSNYFLEAKVLKGSSLIGKNLIKNKLRNLDKIFLAEIMRENRLITPVTPEEVIRENDMLVFTGEINNLHDLEQFDNLKIFGESEDILRGNLLEVVVSHNSEVVGKRIKDVNFRSKFDAAVVAVRHGEKKLSGKIGLIRLEPGDVLVMAVGDDFYKIESGFNNFYFLNKLDTNHRLSGFKGIIATVLFLAAIVASVLEWLPLFKGLLLTLFIYIILKFTTTREIKANLNLDLLLLIGSAIGISEVMTRTGASKLVADVVIHFFHGYGVYGSLLGIYLLTVILTELITNNAAAALAFPLAYSTALALGVNPLPFIMAIAYGASASFITPFGYQTNLLVYSAGSYKFTDYVKFGFPLSVIYGTLAMILIPYFFPF